MGLLNTLRRGGDAGTRKVRLSREELAQIRDTVQPYLRRVKTATRPGGQMSGSAQLFNQDGAFLPLRKAFVGDLEVQYARPLTTTATTDVGSGVCTDGVEVVHSHHLVDWETSEFQLTQLAQANLERAAAAQAPPQQVDELLVFTGESPFTASLLLVPEFWTPFERRFPLGLAVCAPLPTMLLAVDAGNAGGLNRLRTVATNLFERSEQRLSSQLLALRGDGWRPLRLG
jgi:hypothetical protein